MRVFRCLEIPGSIEDVINIHLEFGTKQQFLLNFWHISDGVVEKRPHYLIKSTGLGRGSVSQPGLEEILSYLNW